LVGTLALLVGFLGLVAGAVALIAAPFIYLAKVSYDFLSNLEEIGAGILDWVASAPGAAADFIAGLGAGITAGVGVVVQAIKGLASSAVGALKDALQIRSPSLVFRGIGIQTAKGYVAGVEAGAPEAERAAAEMA